MLIFLVCINIFALGIFLQYFAKDNETDECGFALSAFSGAAIVIAIFVLLIGGSSSREKANQLNIDCANLNYYVHHLENYNERTLVEAINKYNVKLKDFRAKQNSPWLNWFYPGDISECEYIIWVN
jgi:outer membrane murein-binding lipoprotein Lpp